MKEKIKKALIILAIVTSVIIVVKAPVIIRLLTWRDVVVHENAIIIAKAELIRIYGEAEFTDMEFRVSDTYWPYWRVDEKDGELLSRYSKYPQCVLINRSNGRVIVLWRDNLRTRIIATLLGMVY